MLTQEQTADQLEKLIGTLRDGEKGYAESAEKVENAQLQSLFAEFAQQRSQLAAELEPYASQYGAHPRGGSVGAALHRGWISLRDAITARDDKAVIAEVERGEKVATDNYEDVLGEDLPADLKGVIQAQYSRVKAAQERISALKRSLGA
ncbi:MAG: ferritin-like domain-containing protein [Deinococcus sp.]